MSTAKMMAMNATMNVVDVSTMTLKSLKTSCGYDQVS